MSSLSHRDRRSELVLLWHQIRYEQLSFWRNPQSAFFTFFFPVVIITVFGALLGPFAQHTGFDWKNLGVLLAWGAVGALVAVRRFRWNPRPQ